jgi:hypothetical protein
MIVGCCESDRVIRHELDAPSGHHHLDARRPEIEGSIVWSLCLQLPSVSRDPEHLEDTLTASAHYFIVLAGASKCALLRKGGAVTSLEHQHTVERGGILLPVASILLTKR